MPNKMLIDASHPEETRVVVVRGNRIEEFDFESQAKKQLKGNIYLARVTRVEPSLQAAFVEYGGNRHGFLAFSEIHPDYYQIPVADRQALLRAEAEEAQDDEDDDDGEEHGNRSRRRRRGGRSRGRAHGDREASSENGDAVSEADGEASEDAAEDPAEANGDVSDPHDNEATEPLRELPHAIAESVGADVISEDAAPVVESAEAAGNDELRDDQADGGQQDDHEDDDHEQNGHEQNGQDDNGHDDNGNGDDGNGDDEVVSVGADDALEEVHERRRTPRRHYKIQEVIKRRQILLVQVVKEERGNKGAALTTYLSLAGRYSVLMPNTARGGGISRKITNVQDRKRLKDVVKELEVPQGMGVILRTAGESRTKAEIKRDYEYLMRMWDNVRTLTLQSVAPALVYEEGSLIKRSVRDLYNKDIDEILVAGEGGYREAKDFMRMLMPSHAKVVQPYRDPVPIFARSGIEGQLDKMLQPQVTLKSGGYIIINQTEALVAIDVNSGRSTKEHSIEDTALQTNLEAAEEVARQLRLRDLAGLIVIDFIDMEENRNNRAVEKRLKDCLKNDRARIQVGRISHFGLLEMSRQRIRASVLESTMQPCPHCGGTGHIRSESSVALLVIRAIEEFLLKDSRHDISVRTPTSTAIYVLNHKRDTLIELENRFGLSISIEADDSVRSQHYAIFKGAVSERPAIVPPAPVYEEIEDEVVEEEIVDEETGTEAISAAHSVDEDAEGHRRRKRRRRRRGGRDRGEAHAAEADDSDNAEASEAPLDESSDAVEGEVVTSAEDGDDDGAPKKRRRGKRGGRRNRREDGEVAAEAYGEDSSSTEATGELVEAVIEQADQGAMEAVEETGGMPLPEPVAVASPEAASETAAAEPVSDGGPEAEPAAVEPEPAPEPKKRAPRRTTRKAKASEDEVAQAVADLAAEPLSEPAAEQPAEAAPAEEPAKTKPKRAPRRKAAAAPEALVLETTEAPSGDESVAPSEALSEAVASLDEQPQAPAGTADTSEKVEAVPVPESKPSEPVVTSSGPQAEEEAKPRKAGWWQRKGFF